MGGIEKLSYKISNNLGNRLDKSEQEVKVLNYGLFVILHTSIVMLAMLAVGILTQSIKEIMIIAICSAILKRYSGGVHASTPERCLFIGVSVATLLMVVGKIIINKSNPILFFIVLGTGIISSYYIIYSRCPVGSKQKPLNNEKKRKLMRRKSFNTMHIFSSLILACYIIYLIKDSLYMKSICISILSGALIQIFALTRIGEKIIVGIDRNFEK